MVNVDEVREEGDKSSLGVTDRGSRNLDELMETGWFAEERDAFKLAITVALSEGIITEESEMSGRTTKWHRQGVDADLKLKELLRLIEPEAGDEPYNYAERLADAGLELLNNRLTKQHRGLGEVLKDVGHLDDES